MVIFIAASPSPPHADTVANSPLQAESYSFVYAERHRLSRTPAVLEGALEPKLPVCSYLRPYYFPIIDYRMLSVGSRWLMIFTPYSFKPRC